MSNGWFDDFMTSLPIWLPALLGGILLQWLIARSAAISALRKHDRDRQTQVGATEPRSEGPGPAPSA